MDRTSTPRWMPLTAITGSSCCCASGRTGRSRTSPFGWAFPRARSSPDCTTRSARCGGDWRQAMDEHELERRVAARLHQRFDGARPSVALGLRIAAERSQAPVARSRWSWLAPARAAISGVAAVAVVVLLALTVGPRLGVGPWSANGSATPVRTVGPGSATPRPSPWETTYTIVPTIREPAKSTGEAAADVVQARVRHLGIGNFSIAIGDDLTARLPGPVDARVVNALLWPGGVKAY